jgi:hypothetical protein
MERVGEWVGASLSIVGGNVEVGDIGTCEGTKGGGGASTDPQVLDGLEALEEGDDHVAGGAAQGAVWFVCVGGWVGV